MGLCRRIILSVIFINKRKIYDKRRIKIMWLARNKNGDLRLFEMPPRRFHEGPMLSSELTGFNDAITVGNDEYSFWAVQEYYQSNKIDNLKNYGLRLITEEISKGGKVWHSYEPEWAKGIKWEDKPIEIFLNLED